MKVQDRNTDVCGRLCEILSKQQLTLFAGAGVGRHAGIVDWDALLQHLANEANKYEPLTAELMRARAKVRLYAEAAHYYKSCSLIPEGEKFRILASPFQREKYNPARLEQLVKLPFAAIVTTNYDDSLHQAWASAKRDYPLTFELDDGSLKQAAFCNRFYIARIHGRHSKPESMIIDTDDFTKLASNTFYTDFVLQSLLSRRSCLFLGYSFLDPALKRILELLKERVGPNYPTRHFAIVPAGSEDLVSVLAQFNIEALISERHEDLWSCIENLPAKLIGMDKPASPTTASGLPFENLRHYLATCYVSAAMVSDFVPLRDSIIDGIILSIVESADGSIQLATIIEQLRRVIPLDLIESQVVVEEAMERLVQKEWVTLSNQEAALAKKPEKAFNKHVTVLVEGALDRLLVREGVEATSAYEGAVRNTLERMFLTRGWDLGAQFVGITTFSNLGLPEFLRQSFRSLMPSEPFDKIDRLVASTQDLLTKPDSQEAVVLAEVARLCFGLSVVLQSGASAIRSQVLPERIYLDSNVVLCAITEGHPLQSVYYNTIHALVQATGQTGRKCELLVATEFLNEIVHHRERAIEMVAALNLENPEELERHISYYGAENTNVFVGSYATLVGREKKKVSFSEFLPSVAPYTNEISLQRHLKTLGLGVVEISASSSVFLPKYRETLSRLSSSYESSYQDGLTRRKPFILIEHEARQLAQIELELDRGQHSIFVTADNRLRRILNEERIGKVWNVVLSNFALVGLVELLVGLRTDAEGLARFLWGIAELDEVATLRDFFITRAAKKYDEALLMTLPQFTDELARNAAKKAKLEGINFWSRDIDRKAKAARFLDRLEKEFYTKMAEVIRHSKQQNK